MGATVDEVTKHPPDSGGRVTVSARGLVRAGRRWFCRGVAFGPFPGDAPPFLPQGDALMRHLDAVADAGFNSLRTYHPPPEELLEACAQHGLMVWAGYPWPWQHDFLDDPRVLADAGAGLAQAVRLRGGHPALAGWVVANEIRPDMVRWLGGERVRRALEQLVSTGRQADPGALYLYASYPPTEWLHPDNADVVALNIYLEEEDALRRYLRRAHHLAGDRPLMVTECGLDRLSHGEDAQAAWLATAFRVAADEGLAGLMWFTWSDAWRHGSGEAVQGWKFGVVDELGEPHAAAKVAGEVLADLPDRPPLPEPPPLVSVIICTRNGRERIPDCLASLDQVDYPRWEAVVVDDGSDDGTGGLVKRDFPWARVVETAARGLAAARNTGAREARGDIFAYIDDDCLVEPGWMRALVAGMECEGWDAAGGPNIPPPGASSWQAMLDRLPGTAVHVLLDDRHAEHLPGCNLAVTRRTFSHVGGFDTSFHTAGDDVDFCWRLLEAGRGVGYLPGAALWHHRRKSVPACLRQQLGYGRAEALLARRWTERMRDGSARWEGVVYGQPGEVAIYAPPFATVGFPEVYPLAHRPRPPAQATAWERWAFGLLSAMQPWMRWLGRGCRGRVPAWIWPRRLEATPPGASSRTIEFWHPAEEDRTGLLRDLARTLAEDGRKVQIDDGRQDWDLRIEAADGSACVLLSVTEYQDDGSSRSRVRMTGKAALTARVAVAAEEAALARGWKPGKARAQARG